MNCLVNLRKACLLGQRVKNRIRYLAEHYVVSQILHAWRYRIDLIFSIELKTKFVSKVKQETLYGLSNCEKTEWRSHANQYQTSSLTNFRSVFRKISGSDSKFDNFYDIGSGLGKMVFYAEKVQLARNFCGLEADKTLYYESERIKKKINSTSEFFLADAATFLLPTPKESRNLFYLFNPFDELILRKFLMNNMDKVGQSLFIYDNDIHKEVFINLNFMRIFSLSNTSVYTLSSDFHVNP
jgi:hypothetical protein